MTTPNPSQPAARGRKIDPLAAAKVDAQGQPLENPREQVVTLVAAAKAARPNGLSEKSLFADAPRDRLNAMANGFGLGGIAALLSDDEIRLVMDVEQESRMAGAEAPNIHQGATTRGPAIVNPAPSMPNRRSTMKLPESPSGKYRAIEDKRCSLRGQMFWVKRGAVIRVNDYHEGDVELLAESGLKLEPVE